jgi:hypothetical protein
MNDFLARVIWKLAEIMLGIVKNIFGILIRFIHALIDVGKEKRNG